MKKIIFTTIFFALAAFSWGEDFLTAQIRYNGTVVLYEGPKLVANITPQLFLKGWKLLFFSAPGPDQTCDGVANLPDGSELDFKVSIVPGPASLTVHCGMTPLKDIQVLDSRVAVFFPYADWEGDDYSAEGKKSKLPKDVVYANSGVLAKTDDTISLGPSHDGGLKMDLTGSNLHGFLQDVRQWGKSLSVYYTHEESPANPSIWKAGEEKDFNFTLGFNREFAALPAEVPKASRGFAGYWCGFVENGILKKFRIALGLEKDSGGQWSLSDCLLDNGSLHFAEEGKGTVKGLTLTGSLDGKALDLRMDSTGQNLEGTAQDGAKTYSLHLKRGLDFLIPRLDADGKAVTEYACQAPQTLADGWPIGDLGKSPLDPKTVERGVGKILNQRFPNIQGLVLVQKGKLLLDEYFYGFRPGDAHQLQSATKSVLSILFGIAQDRGLVNVQDKLYDYFPEYRSKPGWSEDKNKITLGHLLSMSSGLACDDWLAPGDNCNSEMWKTQDWLSFDLSLPLAYKPGEHFAYTTSCMELLGAVLARKSGMSVPDFAKKVLWDPLGIQAPSWFTGPNQVTEVGGSLQLRPRDMAKLGQLYLQKGKWNGRQVVSEKWVEASTRPQAPNPKDKPMYFEYGYLWWQEQMPYKNRTTEVFYAAGRGGQYIFVAPELDLVCVVTAGNYDSDPIPSEDFFKAYILGAFH